MSEDRITYAQIKGYLARRHEVALRNMAMSKGHDDMLRHQGACQILFELQNLPAAIKALDDADKVAETQERERLKRRKAWRGTR